MRGNKARLELGKQLVATRNTAGPWAVNPLLARPPRQAPISREALRQGSAPPKQATRRPLGQSTHPARGQRAAHPGPAPALSGFRAELLGCRLASAPVMPRIRGRQARAGHRRHQQCQLIASASSPHPTS